MLNKMWQSFPHLNLRGLNRVGWGGGGGSVCKGRKGGGGDCLESPFHEVSGELISASWFWSFYFFCTLLWLLLFLAFECISLLHWSLWAELSQVGSILENVREEWNFSKYVNKTCLFYRLRWVWGGFPFSKACCWLVISNTRRFRDSRF